jgi:hypothetical protein
VSNPLWSLTSRRHGARIGNVGADPLKTFVVTFDSQNRRVRLDRG